MFFRRCLADRMRRIVLNQTSATVAANCIGARAKGSIRASRPQGTISRLNRRGLTAPARSGIRKTQE